MFLFRSFVPRVFALAFIGLASWAQSAASLYLLPDASDPSPRVNSFETAAFSTGPSFPVPPGTQWLYTHPSGTKLYLVSTTATGGTLTILNASAPSTVVKTIEYSSLSGAAFSPDGSRLILLANAAVILDTSTDEPVASLPVDGTPIDAAISLDGTRAFILSASQLAAIDLTTNTLLETTVSVPVNPLAVSVSPSGLVYVSAQGEVQVVDGRSLATRNSIATSGQPGKLSFTGDGKRAIASSGSNLFLFDLQTQSLAGTREISPSGPLTRVLVASNTRAFAVARASQQVFDINLDTLTSAPAQLLTDGQPITGIYDAAVSSEIPASRFLFAVTTSRVYRIEIGIGIASGALDVSSTAGSLTVSTPSFSGVPAAILSYNASQTAAIGQVYQPLITRVTDSLGRPISNVTVNFVSSDTTALIQPATVATNADGWAQTLVTAPGAPTVFTVTATAGTTANAPNAVFSLTAGPTSGGGGGGVQPGLKRYSGNGQLVSQSTLLTEPLVVRLADSEGIPLSGQAVTFTTQTLGGNLVPSTSAAQCSAGVCQVITDGNGLAAIGYLAPVVPTEIGYLPQVVLASVGQVSVNFVVTAFTGGSVTPPLVEQLTPPIERITAAAGSVLPGVIQARVTGTAGFLNGQPVPNIGLQVRPSASSSSAATASCNVEGGVALTNSSGIATCDIKVGTQLGTTILTPLVGGSIALSGGTIVLDVTSGPASTVRLIQGNNVAASPGATVSFTVEVADSTGNIISGQAVSWEVVTQGSLTLNNPDAVTDSAGRASASGVLGSTGGAYKLNVRAGDAVGAFTFSIRLPAATVTKISGDNQNTLLGQPFAAPLVVEVRDASNNPVAGQAVIWQLASGPASISTTSAITDGEGRATVSVTAGNTAGAVVIRAFVGALSQSFNLVSRVSGPSFLAGNVVNSASYQPVLAPCMIATLFGTGIAPGLNGVTAGVPVNGALPTTLEGVQVVVDGVTAPLFAVSNQSGQESVVFQIPCEALTTRQSSITLKVGSEQSTVPDVPITAVGPGIFETVPADNQPRFGTVIKSDGTYASPSNPALRGEIITIVATGLGQVAPATSTNVPGVGGQSMAAPLIVGINHAGIRILSTEYAPGTLGVYYIRVEVPADTATGTSRPLQLAAESAPGQLIYSTETTLAIQ